jgi:Predicted choline kinase involved in LPS biosynthesis
MVSVGGGLTEVELRGETVRRSAGEWTPAVHALLGHLQAVGFDGAPRVLGMDGGVEVLTFVPGAGATHADDELVLVGEQIRAFHLASASFVAPVDARWQFMVGAPREGSVICHNDLSPDNTVYETAGTPCAFIDWDLAAPAPPLWDLAWAAYRFVPLYDEATCELLGFPVGRAVERLRIFCDACGVIERDALLRLVCDRIRVLYDTAREWGQAGRPGWRDVWADTGGEQWLRGLRHVEAQSAIWSRSL